MFRIGRLVQAVGEIELSGLHVQAFFQEIVAQVQRPAIEHLPVGSDLRAIRVTLEVVLEEERNDCRRRQALRADIGVLVVERRDGARDPATSRSTREGVRAAREIADHKV
jgi:hypothetical protein